MIDCRHGYAIARKVDGHYCIATGRRQNSTTILLHADKEPVRRLKIELEEEGQTGLLLVRILDNEIIEITDDRAPKKQS